MPRGLVKGHTADRRDGCAGLADVARAHSGVEGEACLGRRMERCEGGLQAALLIEAGGAAVVGEVEVARAEGIGGQEVRLPWPRWGGWAVSMTWSSVQRHVGSVASRQSFDAISSPELPRMGNSFILVTRMGVAPILR